eukprot:Opistho-2@35098
MSRVRTVALVVFVLSVVCLSTAAAQGRLQRDALPPVPKLVPVTRTLHGDAVVDEFSWLDDVTDPDTLTYIADEKKYADAILSHTTDVRTTLVEELASLAGPYSMELDIVIQNYIFTRVSSSEGAYSVWRRRLGDDDEQIILDENKLAKGKAYFHLGGVSISPDARLLAYACDTVGSGHYDIHIYNMDTNEILADLPNAHTSMAWSQDSTFLLYTSMDVVAHQPVRLYAHPVDAKNADADTLVHEETDLTYRLELSTSASSEYIVLYRRGLTGSDALLISWTDVKSAQISTWAVSHTPTLSIEHVDGIFYLLTGGKDGDGCDNGCVYAINPHPAEGDSGIVLVHKDPSVCVHSIAAYATHLGAFAIDIKSTAAHVRIMNHGTPGEWLTVPLRADYQWGYIGPWGERYPAASNTPKARYEAPRVFFSASGLVLPDTVLMLDENGESASVFEPGSARGHNPADFVARRLFVPPTEGGTPDEATDIPVTVAYSKDALRDNGNPLVLTGIGAYGAVDWPHFDPNWIPLLRRGVVLAIAHVRGSGMRGYSWYNAGRLMHKSTAAEDFARVADYLSGAESGTRWTDASRLAVYGFGVGGFLAGSMLSRWPTKAAVIVGDSPFLDVIGAMADPKRLWTVHNYGEWGDPVGAGADDSSSRAVYFYQKTYDPYFLCGSHHEHPTVLLHAGKDDHEVGFGHAAKMIAKLRSHSSGRRRADGGSAVMALQVIDGGFDGESGSAVGRAMAYKQAFILDSVARDALCASALTPTSCSAMSYCVGCNQPSGDFECLLGPTCPGAAVTTTVTSAVASSTHDSHVASASQTHDSVHLTTHSYVTSESASASVTVPSHATSEISVKSSNTTAAPVPSPVTHSARSVASSSSSSSLAAVASSIAPPVANASSSSAAEPRVTSSAAESHVTHPASTVEGSSSGAVPDATSSDHAVASSAAVTAIPSVATPSAAPLVTPSDGVVVHRPHVDDPTGALIGFSSIFACVIVATTVYGIYLRRRRQNAAEAGVQGFADFDRLRFEESGGGSSAGGQYRPGSARESASSGSASRNPFAGRGSRSKGNRPDATAMFGIDEDDDELIGMDER